MTEENKIIKTGYTFGTICAVWLSAHSGHSILHAVIAGALSWFYVILYFVMKMINN